MPKIIEIGKYLFKLQLKMSGVFFETHCIARWKACGRLPIRHNWTFFAISYGWDIISGNLAKLAFFEGVGHFECKFQTEGASPTNHCRCQRTRVTALPRGIKISALHCFILSKSTRASDRWTDRQTDCRITTANTALACVACVARKKTEDLHQYELHMSLCSVLKQKLKCAVCGPVQ